MATELASLSPEDKLTVLEQLWDSLSLTPEALPLPDEQRLELDRRLEALGADENAGSPWTEVESRLRSRR